MKGEKPVFPGRAPSFIYRHTDVAVLLPEKSNTQRSDSLSSLLPLASRCASSPMAPKSRKAAPPKEAEAPTAAAIPDAAESNERIIPSGNDWEPPKIMIKPREQLSLTDKELSEEFTKIMRADNPEAPKNIVRFSHKEKCFKLDAGVDQSDIDAAVHAHAASYGLGQRTVSIPSNQLGFIQLWHVQKSPVAATSVTES